MTLVIQVDEFKFIAHGRLRYTVLSGQSRLNTLTAGAQIANQ